MNKLYERCFEIVLGHEGGFQDIYHDRGNWTTGVVGKGINKGTKFGITAMSYPQLDIKNLTVEDAREIYYKNYWLAAGCDKLSPPLALVVFDTAVNSGVGRAKQFLSMTKDWKYMLDVRLNFMRSLAIWPQWGNGWTARINRLRRQAQDLADEFSKPDPAPQPQPRQVRVFIDDGDGTPELVTGVITLTDLSGATLDARNPEKIVLYVNRGKK